MPILFSWTVTYSISSESEPNLTDVWSDDGWGDFWKAGKKEGHAGLQSPPNINRYRYPLLLLLRQPHASFDLLGLFQFYEHQPFIRLFVGNFSDQGIFENKWKSPIIGWQSDNFCLVIHSHILISFCLYFTKKNFARHRSAMVSINTLMDNLGWLIGISLGLLVPLENYSFVLCLPSVLFLSVCWLLVESPMWLVRQNRKEEAINTLRLLRGENYVVDEEIEEMQNIVEEEKRTRETKSKWSLIKSRTFLLPSLLTSISFTLQVLSGIELCCYYVGFIFQNINIRHEFSAIITQVFTNIFCTGRGRWIEYCILLFMILIYERFAFYLIHSTFVKSYSYNYYHEGDHNSWLHVDPPAPVQIWLQEHLNLLPPGDLPGHVDDGTQLHLPGHVHVDHPLLGGGRTLLWSRSESDTLIGRDTSRYCALIG